MAQQIFFGIYWNLLDSTVFYCIYSYISPRYKLWFVTPVGFVSRYLPFGGSEGGADHKTQDWGLKVDESGTVSLPTMWAACRQICRTVMNTTIARALIIGNACLKWFGHVALWKDWKRFPGAGLFTMRQFSLAASGSMFGCRRRSRFALWCIRSEDLNSALTVSGCPWCLICLCFRCCCFETGMLWYVMMSYMLLISVLFACGVRSCSVSIVFAVFAAGNLWRLQPVSTWPKRLHGRCWEGASLSSRPVWVLFEVQELDQST